MVVGVVSSGLKRPGLEADQSPPSSTEVQNVWSETSTPSYDVALLIMIARLHFVVVYEAARTTSLFTLPSVLHQYLPKLFFGHISVVRKLTL
jgi:hypothetical protein